MNTVGDEEGCRHRGRCRQDADRFRRGIQTSSGRTVGWGITADPDHGGQGLPHIACDRDDHRDVVLRRTCRSPCTSRLNHGAYSALGLPRLRGSPGKVHAESGPPAPGPARCASPSPSAGTDLGLLTSRAEPQDDGTHLLSGSKIFIYRRRSRDNREYRPPGAGPASRCATEGVKGISLVRLTPKMRYEDGKLILQRCRTCGSLEHKMGIKGSSTCEIALRGQRGSYLVGEPHRGMRGHVHLHERGPTPRRPPGPRPG